MLRLDANHFEFDLPDSEEALLLAAAGRHERHLCQPFGRAYVCCPGCPTAILVGSQTSGKGDTGRGRHLDVPATHLARIDLSGSSNVIVQRPGPHILA